MSSSYKGRLTLAATTLALTGCAVLMPTTAFAATPADTAPSTAGALAEGNCPGPMNRDGSCVPLFPPGSYQPAPPPQKVCHRRGHKHHHHRVCKTDGPVVH
jgi:hypothetical protein